MYEAPAMAVIAPAPKATRQVLHQTAHDHAQPVSLHWRAKLFISSEMQIIYYFSILKLRKRAEASFLVL